MKIERINSKELVATILAIDDSRLDKYVLKPRGCTKAEYVQGLTRQIVREHFMRIWGVVEDEKVKYYMVAFNAVAPPFSREMYIWYQNFYGLKDENGNHLGEMAEEKVMEWARECGAFRVNTFTNKPKVMSMFGYQVEKGFSVYKNVKY